MYKPCSPRTGLHGDSQGHAIPACLSGVRQDANHQEHGGDVLNLTPEQAERAITAAKRLEFVMEVFIRHAEYDRDSGRVVYYENVLKETQAHISELEGLKDELQK